MGRENYNTDGPGVCINAHQACSIQFCKTCTHWKNQQAELEYSKTYGICTCYRWKFDTLIEGDCVLLDRGNKSSKFKGVHRFESQSKNVPVGATDKSRYCLVTEESFGCIHYDQIKPE